MNILKVRSYFFQITYAFKILRLYLFLGNWGECNPNICTKNELYSQEDNKLALEVNDLINQFKVNDNLNKIIGTRSQDSDSDEECECVNVTKCPRTNEVLDKISTLSRLHPQRKTLISYIRSLICDTKNRGVRCCGEKTGTAPITQPRTTTQRTRPISANEKVFLL